MRIYCTESFKNAFDKLGKKKAYKTLESEIISYFFDKQLSELLSGTRLNNSTTEPYIKKRLEGSGGYRLYFLILIRNEDVYLMLFTQKQALMALITSMTITRRFCTKTFWNV